MKIIIDIPEHEYNYLKKLNYISLGRFAFKGFIKNVIDSIKNGVVIKDNHRFIDADMILENAFIEEDDEGDIFTKKYYCIEKSIFDNSLIAFDTLEIEEDNDEM